MAADSRAVCPNEWGIASIMVNMWLHEDTHLHMHARTNTQILSTFEDRSNGDAVARGLTHRHEDWSKADWIYSLELFSASQHTNHTDATCTSQDTTVQYLPFKKKKKDGKK